MNTDGRWLADDRFLNLAGRCSITLTFALDLFQGGNRYRSIDVEQIKNSIQKDEIALYESCIKPCASFFDDILNARSEATSQQFTFLLKDHGPQGVQISFPASFDFTAEGQRFHINRAYRHAKPLRADLREAMTLFSNGMLFVNATIVFPDAGEWDACASEYDLLTLQKLVCPTEECRYLRGDVLFAGAERDSAAQGAGLIDFLQARIQNGLQKPGNILHQIFTKMLGQHGVAFKNLDWPQLYSAAVFINSADVFEAVEAFIKTETGPATDHLRLMAGLLQNIADFRRQDDSEVRESLRPIRSDGVLSIYAHPKFLVELNLGSRTYDGARDDLGTCPYFYLIQVFGAYREKLADILDFYIEQIAYGSRSDVIVNNRYMRDHVDLLTHLDAPLLGAGGEIVKKFARVRLGLFRDFFSRMPPNIFRYENEKLTLENILEARGIADRVEAGTAMFAEHEKCVKDIHGFGEHVAEKQISRFLLIIAVLGIVEVCANLSELMGASDAPSYLKITAYGVAIAGVAYLVLRVLAVLGSFASFMLRRAGLSRRPARHTLTF
jgi:hypothetical protein